MQKPQESLDDFLNTEPQPMARPLRVELHPTGEIEVLRPLTVDHASAEAANGLLLQHGAPRISWFHRSLIFAGGTAAALAIIFLSALLIAETSDGALADVVDSPSVTSEASSDESRVQAEESAAASILTSKIPSNPVGEHRALRKPFVRSQRRIPNTKRVAFIPQRKPRPANVPTFVPTTLIIYAENGEIKTRIEPSVAAYKIPASFLN